MFPSVDRDDKRMAATGIVLLYAMFESLPKFMIMCLSRWLLEQSLSLSLVY